MNATQGRLLIAQDIPNILEKPIDNDELLRTISELLTQGPSPLPIPLKEREFLKSYRERLEIKLGQKAYRSRVPSVFCLKPCLPIKNRVLWLR